MRVIFDANVWLSYLINRPPYGTVAMIIDGALLSDEITVLAPLELVREIAERAENKRYFRDMVPQGRVEGLLSLLASETESLPELDQELEHYARDRKDDYLVAYGLVHEADFLVTGDRDLLVLERLQNLRIVTPATFRRILET